MKQSPNRQNTHTLTSMIAPVIVFISRLGVLPGNFSPLGSYGFFSGNFIAYAIIILGFDLLVGGTYKGNYFTYLGFLAYYIFGRIARNNYRKQLLLLPLSSFLFFVISNFGVFLYWYPHTIQGLLNCYLLALPFYTRTLLGDLIFGYSYLMLSSRLTYQNTKLTLFGFAK